MYHKYRDFKTCGVLETDEELGIQKVAAPLGLVGAILPVTNPTSSAIFKILLCMKTRNAILLSPHPKAKDCTWRGGGVLRRGGLPGRGAAGSHRVSCGACSWN